MGTLLDIKIFNKDKNVAESALAGAFQIAQDLDQLLSNYKDDSELSILNQKAGYSTIKVSQAMWEFLNLTVSLSKITEGYFDPTIMPLFELWKKNERPNITQIDNALKLVGIKNVKLIPDRQIRFDLAGVAIDSGGIGKGFAVDKIVDYLRSKGIESALINFGRSSIYGIGHPPNYDKWDLKVEFFDAESNKYQNIYLKDEAFTASFSYAPNKLDPSIKEPHIINPITGFRITENIKSKVISRSASLGEAISKYALFVTCNKLKNTFLEENPKISRIVSDVEEQCS